MVISGTAKVEATVVYRVENEADPMPVAHSTGRQGPSPIVVSSVAMNDNRIVVGTDTTTLSPPTNMKEPRGEEWKGLNPAGLTANVSDL